MRLPYQLEQLKTIVTQYKESQTSVEDEHAIYISARRSFVSLTDHLGACTTPNRTFVRQTYQGLKEAREQLRLNLYQHAVQATLGTVQAIHEEKAEGEEILKILENHRKKK